MMPLRELAGIRYCFFSLLLTASLMGCGGSSVAPVQSYAYYQKPRDNTYTVSPGDTLYSIAWAYGVDYRDLAAHNGIDESFTIYPGQRLDVSLDSKARGSGDPGPGPGAPTHSLSTDPGESVSASSPAPRSAPPAPPAQTSTQNQSATLPPPKQAVTAHGSKVERWGWPADGQIVTDFASSGGKGIDISGKIGQPVLAAAEGRVVYSGGGLRGYGELIIVKHNKRYLSAYAHNNRILVKEGDEVKIGQRIAEMGSTGTESVRLHFEIRRDGRPVNPVRYLPKLPNRGT
jgi:lipoprotein NlpD